MSLSKTAEEFEANLRKAAEWEVLGRRAAALGAPWRSWTGSTYTKYEKGFVEAYAPDLRDPANEYAGCVPWMLAEAKKRWPSMDVRIEFETEGKVYICIEDHMEHGFSTEPSCSSLAHACVVVVEATIAVEAMATKGLPEGEES